VSLLTDGLAEAFELNAQVAERVASEATEPPDLGDPASEECIAVAVDLGYSEEEAHELMNLCLVASSKGDDPVEARKSRLAVSLAVGHYFGVLARVRQTGAKK
jgi:hypothetical protein